MEGMTTEDKLLAQDDIDALLGEAGIEGSYESDNTAEPERPQLSKEKTIIKFAKRSDNEAKVTMTLLRNKAFLEREDDVKVIWNALGTIPMVTGINMKIQDMEYVSLGVLHENHLVVKYMENT
ncbi:hypothetical protein ACFLZG_02920 [Thermodesulfobacteriota bacterium]